MFRNFLISLIFAANSSTFFHNLSRRSYSPQQSRFSRFLTPIWCFSRIFFLKILFLIKFIIFIILSAPFCFIIFLAKKTLNTREFSHNEIIFNIETRVKGLSSSVIQLQPVNAFCMSIIEELSSGEIKFKSIYKIRFFICAFIRARTQILNISQDFW